MAGADLFQENVYLIPRQVNKPIVLWAGLDVAVFAGDIAESAGVKPKGLQRAQGDLSTRLSLGGKRRVGKRRSGQFGCRMVGHVSQEYGQSF